MNAYELADEFKNRNWDEVDCVLWCEKSANMLRQQADRIAELEETIGACYAVQKMQAEEVYKGNDRIAELEKLLEHSVGSDCREMRYIQEIENKDARIAELEKKLQESALDYISVCSQADEHYARVQELEKQLAFMEGEYPEPTIVQKMQEFANLEQALRKIAKYEEVLHAIANDYHELSDHKIEVQVRNHKKWARDVLSDTQLDT